MGTQDFEVSVYSTTSTLEEYQRAMTAPVSELPPLSEEQKQAASRFGTTEEELARSELVKVYGREGLRQRGQRLGEIAQRILAEVDSQCRLVEVLYEGLKQRWILRIDNGSRSSGISLNADLADDITKYQLHEAVQQLRHKLAEAIREEMVGKVQGRSPVETK